MDLVQHFIVGKELGLSPLASWRRAQTCPGMVKERASTSGRNSLDQILVPDNEETRAHFSAPRTSGRKPGRTQLDSARAVVARLSEKQREALLEEMKGGGDGTA